MGHKNINTDTSQRLAPVGVNVEIMRKKIYLIFLLLPIFFGSQCHKDECHKNILFINEDSINVYVQPYFGSDTAYMNNAYPGEEIKSNSMSKTAISLRDCFEYRVPSETPPLLKIVVTNAKLVNDSSWEYVSSHKLILKQYSLSIEDIQNMNWTITYP